MNVLLNELKISKPVSTNYSFKIKTKSSIPIETVLNNSIDDEKVKEKLEKYHTVFVKSRRHPLVKSTKSKRKKSTLHVDKVQIENIVKTDEYMVMKVTPTSKSVLVKSIKNDDDDEQKQKQNQSQNNFKNFENNVSFKKYSLNNINGLIPSKQLPFKLKASPYYLNNRKTFIQFMNRLLLPYKKKNDETTLSCDKSANLEFELLPHQKLIQEYLNIYTPYRGLLLYHGLGSGKTCSSITIAEGFKSDKQVIVMTPQSLNKNYREELQYCGDILYKKLQYWEFVEVKPNTDLETYFVEIFHLKKEFIQKQKGVWIMHKSKPANYKTFSSKEQKMIDKQVTQMIESKYQFIHYNGLRRNKFAIMTKNFTVNPFHNKVIVIDEAHNFVSMIVNKINKGNREALVYILYEYLLSAENCKIILLSGTPVINYPNEVAVLFNILRGYIYTLEMKLEIQTREKVNQSFFKNLLSGISTMDYINYNPSTTTLTITKNPFGFVNEKNNMKFKTVDGEIDMNTFTVEVMRVFNEKNIVVKESKKIDNLLLPELRDDFNSIFFKSDSGLITNENMFKRRILGLTSYFRSPQEQLMPRFNPNEDIIMVKVKMDNYQFSVYNEYRHIERKKEGKKRKKNEDFSSSYRGFSRMACNFVFPPFVKRPKIKNIFEVELEKESNEDGGEEKDDEEKEKEKDEDEEEDEDEEDEDHKIPYSQQITIALQKLKEQSKNIFAKDKLIQYGGKLLALCNQLEEKSDGLHLIYSQFKNLGGINIIKLVLEENGFAEFKLKRSGLSWDIEDDEKDVGKPKFVLYTGSETTEEKELIRNIYNGNWDVIPLHIRNKLKSISNHNKNGEIIQVFMITSSGAEGISLKNTNYIHIVDSHWHPVRREQVIGRARRICSHEELPKEKRFVKVFMYLMELTDEQIRLDESKELRKFDISKEDKYKYNTTDEYLHEISERKKRTNESILKAIKESAIDCAVYDDKDVNCFTFPRTTHQTFSYTPSIDKEEVDMVEDINKKRTVFSGKVVTVKGIKYVMQIDDKGNRTNMIYDLKSYHIAKKDKSGRYQPQFVGRLDGGEIVSES